MGIYFDQNNNMIFDCRNGEPEMVMSSNCDQFILDIEGNRYDYVQIGNQYWTTSNLKTTKYSDGTSIPCVSGYNDWFLPSKDELDAIRTELYLYGVGGITDNVYYWTSSEFSATHSYMLQFGTNTSTVNSKDGTQLIRAIRSFTSTYSYSLRDIGPAGGLIFWKSGDNYLEAAQIDCASNIWSNISGTTCGATGTTIGTGQSNTTTIIAQSGHTISAAATCNGLGGNQTWTGLTDSAYCWYNNARDSASDWFLPSKDELQSMYDELYLYGVGDFSANNYWSSSESNSTEAWICQFNTGSFIGDAKYDTGRVRACRSFTSTTSYSLRDIGPSGGYIFYKSGNNYLECASTDQSTGWAWSNVTGTTCGATGTTIGTGQANTTAIIGQSGGANDWFLPSRNELYEMYLELKAYGVGGFSNDWYFSSSEENASRAYARRFTDSFEAIWDKTSSLRVRACRRFASTTSYSLRDTGPAGGLIFYKDNLGGGSYDYLEAGSLDISTGQTWSNITDAICGASGTTIGTGQANTTAIITQSGHTNSCAKICNDYDDSHTHTSSAAKLCDDLITTGYKEPYGALYNWYAVNKKFDDWYLPSLDELQSMYDELHLYGLGNFNTSTGGYWSSSEGNTLPATYAQVIDFSDGSLWQQTKSSIGISIRACRSFTTDIREYSLRNVGPAGGYIFHITGTTYYEAAPSDQATGHTWSNVTSAACGSSGTTIGTGQLNTALIICQSGHTDSSAQTSRDYEGNQKLIYFTNETNWRVSSHADWQTLISYIGGTTGGGGKLKETGTSHWTTPNSGALDTYGFKAVPGGERGGSTGTFDWIGTYCDIWGYSGSTFNFSYMRYDDADIGIGDGTSKRGFSVRCVKDI